MIGADNSRIPPQLNQLKKFCKFRLPGNEFARFHGSVDLKTLRSEVRVDKVAPQGAVTTPLHGQNQSADVTLTCRVYLRLGEEWLLQVLF